MSHDLTEFFYSLTPERVLTAVEVDGRTCTGRFIVLNSYENRVYQLELSGGTFVVGKFYRPGRWTDEAIYDEHDFIDALDDHEIPVVPPMDLAEGDTLDDVGGIRFSLFPRVGGRAVEEPNDEQLRRLGFLLARIHAIGRTLPAEHRMELTPATYGRDNMAFLLDNDLIGAASRDRWARAADDAVTQIEAVWGDVPIQTIHGDCHLGNILWTDLGPTFLDFDDMVRGPVVQDLWLLFGGRDIWGQKRRDTVIEGYEGFSPFPRGQLRLVEPLRTLRYIHFTAWLARRYEDPAFQVAFPHFGTDHYWAERVGDLLEQTALIASERGP
jgi:Ser/Thr protein kinase RdoA (MazF antagonist)